MLSLQEISDRMEIGMLLERYAGAIDRVDLDQLDSVFTPNAVLDFSAFSEWGGFRGPYPQVRAWLAERLSMSRGHQHIVANKEIELDGDRARGRVLCLNPKVLAGKDVHGRPNVGFHGLWYLDEYLRISEGWRITARSETRCFSHNFPAAE